MFHVVALLNPRRQVVYIEMAVHGLGEQIAPPKPDMSAQLKTVDLVVMDHDVRALVADLEVLIGLVKVICVIGSVLISNSFDRWILMFRFCMSA